jgi:hypothetical protein
MIKLAIQICSRKVVNLTISRTITYFIHHCIHQCHSVKFLKARANTRTKLLGLYLAEFRVGFRVL